MNTETAKLGEGIYTAADAARILRIPYWKANYWFQYYVKHKLFETIAFRYHFPIKDTVAVNFLTLIEMYVFYQLKDKKVKISDIITAHSEMSKALNTPYPFAKEDLYVDPKGKLWFGEYDQPITADKRMQTTLANFAKLFLTKVDFGNKKMATKFYPLSRDKTVVVNPQNQFGQPIIEDTNILTDTIYDLHLGGDSSEMICKLYDITPQNVKDAIEFSKAA